MCHDVSAPMQQAPQLSLQVQSVTSALSAYATIKAECHIFLYSTCTVLVKNKYEYKSTRPVFCVYGPNIVLQTLWRCTLTKGSCERCSKECAGHLMSPHTFLSVTKEDCSEMSSTSCARSSDKIAHSASPWVPRCSLVHFYSMSLFYASLILVKQKGKKKTTRRREFKAPTQQTRCTYTWKLIVPYHRGRHLTDPSFVFSLWPNQVSQLDILLWTFTFGWKIGSIASK